MLGGGCSAYDPALLDPLDERPTHPVSTPPGGVAGDVVDPGTSGAAICGDGRVSAGEKCDPGIETGLPGACPATCWSLIACVDRVLDGGGCLVECVDAPRACEAGDGCCPAGCDHDSDGDCSQSCGDGVVQVDEGESCEPDSTSDPCPSECDDGDPCTTDALSGSASNCNAECTTTPVTSLVAGDGCCPDGANANGDDDCAAECGNGVLEAGEDCDGGDGCEPDCTSKGPTTAQEQCLALFASPDPCEECSCMACTDLMLNCYASGDAARNVLCVDVVDCARANDCTSDPCYCGTLNPLLQCPFASPPPGPCVAEIEAAASATGATAVFLNRGNTAYALYHADVLGNCSVTNCPSVCP